MNAKQQKELSKFKDRVRFDLDERILYGHDISAIPSLVKPIVGNTIPDAVIQPENEEELSEVILWAYKNNIPVTPRSKASSGYGGAIPLKKGLVIDFYRLSKVLSIDEKNMTVTAEAGITWEKL